MIPIGETRDGRADMTNFELDLFDVKFTRKGDSEEYCKKSCSVPPACLPITIIALLIMLVFIFFISFGHVSADNGKFFEVFIVPIINEDNSALNTEPGGSSYKKYERSGLCTDQCRYSRELINSPFNLLNLA